ncbi:hypothetical protein IRT38_00855 (plasmid) [Acinetobacter sp. SK-43]|uniref:hypothetical protein n=1 Tax=Acinetobacter sp. SK-43 TaxID=2785295 RepID=UPI00188A1F79|nr:hypothetical protein [Acinetobacter sp. SK-43]MBF4453965.1 hypothetical protein [Acinetobacter sp. SK-43]
MSIETSKRRYLAVTILCALIGGAIGNLIMSQVFSFRNADGVPCENSLMSFKVTCPPLESEKVLLPTDNLDDSNVTLTLEKDKAAVPESPLSGLPMFFSGIRPDYVLNPEEVQQLLNNNAYQKYKEDPRLKPILEEAKKDSVLSIGEYQKIEAQLEKMYFEDKRLSDKENAKQFVDQL